MLYNDLWMEYALRQKAPTASDAYALFNGAEYSRCLDLVKGIGTPEALALRARCHIKMRDPLAALGCAGAMPQTGDRVAERFMLLGTAASRLHQNEEAEAYFAQALRHAPKGTREHADVQYFRALHYWGLGQYELSDELLTEPLNPRYCGRAKALELHAWNLEGQLRYDEHIEALKAALNVAVSAQCVDKSIVAAVLHGLAVMSRERYLPELANLVRRYFDLIPVNDSTFHSRFEVNRSLGWGCANEGDFMGAYRHLRTAREMAKDPLWRAWACADRAMLAFAIGEHMAGEDTLEYIHDIVGESDWETAGEERLVLLTLAAIEAPRNVELARRYIQKYRGIKTAISPMQVMRNSPRRTALEDYTEGLVLRYEGKIKEAREHIESAWKFWRMVKFKPRMALASVELGELRKSTAEIDCAEQILREMPHSYIGAKIADRLQRWRVEEYRTLTDRQREVLHAVCRGLTNQQIAEEQGVQMTAVRNRLHEVFEKFGVGSRAQLIIECQNRGIK